MVNSIGQPVTSNIHASTTGEKKSHQKMDFQQN